VSITACCGKSQAGFEKVNSRLIKADFENLSLYFVCKYPTQMPLELGVSIFD